MTPRRLSHLFLSPENLPSNSDQPNHWQCSGSVFIWVRIRIQHFLLNTDPDPDPIRIQVFNEQKLKKNYS
jgi:hypothetical protein